MTPTFTCLIPAHNEAARIAGVLAAVQAHPTIHAVVVVDDGSTDDTAAIAGAAGVQVLRLVPNRGKSAALAEALRRVCTSHVLLLDADLTGLRAADLSALLAPVAEGHTDVSLSLRGNAPRVWHWLGVDYITGERVLPMWLVRPLLPQMAALPRFGLEVFLNSHIRSARLSVAIVRWGTVASPSKAQKSGWRAGVRADIGMMRDILRTVSVATTFEQIAYLRRASQRSGPRSGLTGMAAKLRQRFAQLDL
ncbi:MAG: glycosyltransferase family 2 protein [Pseudotabrizicola sp.]|uniref:glycosyltransferase family 2 protein n=1 Tax=Pseudotabrizicola sp. TaxID=2939647 RepID=UPI0027218B14|nr:glycosyltransferase family 2 protein [Pseudotabrizicola sp.]MDO9637062.1 glycosyltransferase family 2 protein [Pseudotabrizicola sp.]